MNQDEKDLSHILNHLGEERELYFNAIAPPIMQSSNFAFENVEDLRVSLMDEYHVPIYSRGNNPTVEILRKKMAALEGTEDALVFGSGSAAISAGVIANLKKGDHAICVAKPYSWTQKLFSTLLDRFGVEVSYIRGLALHEYDDALRPNTKMVFLESPNSFTFDLQNLPEIAEFARKNGLISMIDNSYSGPLYQNPAEYGIDIIAHSASKYISGHSDVVAGILCGSKAMMQKVFSIEYMTLGSIISPLNAWLLLRGLRTLELRLERSSESALKVLRALENHPKISRIFYPHHPSHPQYALAKQQMKKAGGLFTLEFNVQRMEEVEHICNRLRRFLIAVSWGGHESLIFPACASYSGGGYKPEDLNWKLVRFYIGFEDPKLLIEDILHAIGD
jgi:cystathionine beta-lyase/cystathionine gamma-synthase